MTAPRRSWFAPLGAGCLVLSCASSTAPAVQESMPEVVLTWDRVLELECEKRGLARSAPRLARSMVAMRRIESGRQSADVAPQSGADHLVDQGIRDQVDIRRRRPFVLSRDWQCRVVSVRRRVLWSRRNVACRLFHSCAAYGISDRLSELR